VQEDLYIVQVNAPLYLYESVVQLSVFGVSRKIGTQIRYQYIKRIIFPDYFPERLQERWHEVGHAIALQVHDEIMLQRPVWWPLQNATTTKSLIDAQ